MWDAITEITIGLILFSLSHWMEAVLYSQTFLQLIHNFGWKHSYRVCVLRVQKGAVCQCWLSCVKQVRPGMLQVSLLRRRFSNFLSFFLRFCSSNNQAFLSLSFPFLLRTREQSKP